MVDIYHIVGPPGTGKTTKIMDIIEDSMSKGIAPNDIGFISFTRAAIQEARQRAIKRFGVKSSDLEFFNTIHSMCFRYLGLHRSKIMNKKHWKEFFESLNIRYSEMDEPSIERALDEPWEPAGREEGDILRQWYDWTRNNCLPLEESARNFESPLDEPWIPERAIWFTREYEDYKKQKGLYDFCDLLIEVDKLGWFPPVEMLFLDEAQDLSPLQQKLFKRWANYSKVVYLGYDDDQCIYGFQGANPTWLLEYPGQRIVLETSHRVPQKPARLALRLISRNVKRHPKTWNPKPEKGNVYFDADFEMIKNKLFNREQSWFILTRNNFYLQQFTSDLLTLGIPFVNLRGTSPLTKIPVSVIAAIRLATGLNISMYELYKLSEDTNSDPWWLWGAKTRIKNAAKENPEELLTLQDLTKYGATKELIEILTNINTCLAPLKRFESNKEYFLKIYHRYGLRGLKDKPHITLGSFHSVKGKQADNVVILPNMSRRTSDSYAKDPEPERRVWYVAITRCQNELYILEPKGSLFFDEW